MSSANLKIDPRAWRTLAGAALAAMALLSSHTAFASQGVSQVYHGNWNCNLHGRSAKMAWKIVDDTRTECSGGRCSVSHGVKEVGSFKDGSGPWVSLTALGTSTQSITFRHADGNKWYLARTSARQLNGHSTWQGNQYPLSCWR